MSLQPKLLVGIAGGSGSGKSTLCDRITHTFGDDVVVLGCDHYYTCLAEFSEPIRAATNFDHPDSLDFNLLATHVRELAAGKPIQRPEYCFATHTRKPESVAVQPALIVLVEGILLFTDPPLRELFDLKIFVDAPDDVRLQRRLDRDVNERGRTEQSVRDQWATTVLPMHQSAVEPTRPLVDLILHTDHNNDRSTQVLVNGIRSLLG